jgi:hypothetical protein
MELTKGEMNRIFSEDPIDTSRLEKYGGEAEATYKALGTCSVGLHWDCDPTHDIP